MKFLSRLCFYTYATLTTLIAPFGVAYLAYKKRKDPPYGSRIFELLGFYDQGFKSCIWFHTVSVGEIIAATPVIRAFIQRHPKLSIVVTTTTTTGAKEALKIDGITHVYAPLDSPGAVKRFLKCFNPTHLFIMETELWPNLLYQSHKYGVKTCVFNARMPEKTCQSYEKYKNLSKDILADSLDFVISQSKSDGARFERFGVPKNKILIASSLKYDLHPKEELFAKARKIKKTFKGKVIAAISTHEGEEDLILEKFYALKTVYTDLILVLVPRHLAGIDRAIRYLDQVNARYQLRTTTAWDLSNFTGEVFLGNTIGEIEFYLGLSDIVFMGGSLVDVGGHNPLEAAYFSLPIITGPYYYNFDEQYNNLIEQRGAYMAKDHIRLFNILQMFLEDEELMLNTGIQAMDVQMAGRGALEKTLDFLETCLKAK